MLRCTHSGRSDVGSTQKLGSQSARLCVLASLREHHRENYRRSVHAKTLRRKSKVSKLNLEHIALAHAQAFAYAAARCTSPTVGKDDMLNTLQRRLRFPFEYIVVALGAAYRPCLRAGFCTCGDGECERPYGKLSSHAKTKASV